MRAFKKSEAFGAATVGERGQIVIPAQVRKMVNIRSGDQLIVFGKPDSVMLIPAKDFGKFLDKAGKIMTRIESGSPKK